MFEAAIYKNRRKALKERVGGGLILILGNVESPANYPDNTYKFRQDSSFLYFWGIDEPWFAAVLDLDSADECLYGNDVDIDDIIWMGPQPSLAEKAQRVGVAHTRPLAQLAKRIEAAVAKGRRIHFLPPYRGETTLMLSRLLGIVPDRLPA